MEAQGYKTINMRKSNYIILILVLLIHSCALKKEYVIGDNKGVTSKKIVKTINQNKNTFTTIQARARIDYSSKNKIKTNTATIRILAGEKIWISAPIGAIRMLITKDSIQYYNKLERNYIKADFSYIENILGIGVSYDMLENLLFGFPVIELSSKDFDKKLNKDDNQTDNLLRSYIFKKEIEFDSDQLTGIFYINPYNFRLNSQKFYKEINNASPISQPQQTFSINYKNYNKINTSAYAKNILFLDWKNKTINIEMRSVVIDKKLNIPFKIPKGYKKIKID